MKHLSVVTLLLAVLKQAEAVHFLGRVNPATRQLTWPGTGVSFSFTGTQATIDVDAINGTNSFLLTVDGTSTIIPNVNTSTITTPAGLANGNHTVELRKRSEAYFGSITVGNVTTDGTLGPDVVPTRKIEFIGDSITVGYGLDGVNPCTNTAALEDNPKTYAALAAKSLRADYSIVAWSGIGLIRNTIYPLPDQTLIMPERWTNYGANEVSGIQPLFNRDTYVTYATRNINTDFFSDPVRSYTFPEPATPDAVVIALGTNDFVYAAGVRPPISASNFTAAMVSFVHTVETRYPNAQFFLVGSPILSDASPAGDLQKTTHSQALINAVAQIGAKAHFVEWPTQGTDVGCDYHPNAETNAKEAPVLTAAIAEAMGWQGLYE